MVSVVKLIETGEIEIRGDRRGLIRLADFVASPKDRTFPLVPPRAFGPYNCALRSIDLVHRDGLVALDTVRNSEVLTIAGSEQLVRVLAENIDELGRICSPGEHAHIEWFPDHFYLAEESEAIVVTLEPDES